MKLVVELPATMDAHYTVVRRARAVAAARAEYEAKDIPTENFERLWAAEWAFLTSARLELGLPVIARDEMTSLERTSPEL
ncbi:hypothetical protein BKM31_25740 [[Actinomadura] parvosata subsp. kistnae]|uniref:Uncharacterized protein n=1 Tax=[Actinomadura] parvosata subsp. kistnae TaxID=1909395 RepID=A0A1V0A2H4_9ACTN|nr:hypothetical protein [Nonomuraea sp. ATCC 55076]AQZ64410.1 hypothetical protein BKM31_25740 [Nonomuraea sp. ATCC 55076]